MATPINPDDVLDFDQPLNSDPDYSVTHVFSTDDIVGTFDGLTQGDGGPDVIDFTAMPKITKEGVELYPINSEFGYIVTDFDGAVEKDFFDNPEFAEGYAGDLLDDTETQIGLVVSDAPTAKFQTPAVLGTWLSGLGGNAVKASTEHYSVMQEILSNQAFPDDPDADYVLDDELVMIGGKYDGMLVADAIPLAGDTNGDGILDIRDVLQPNEATITENIAASSDYSVTLKDDGKLLYRWGNMIKKPNDIRIEAELPLPDEWKEADPVTDLAPLFRITQAELVTHHTITNNPNDQIRPEDYENESAIGTLPTYEVLADGRWVTTDDYYAGDGTLYPAGTVLKDPALAAAAIGSTLDQSGAMSEDLHEGYTNAWYTTMDREPFEPVLNADGTEYITGPRWRLLPDKYGQDLPGVEIPIDTTSPPPPQKDDKKYEVGAETQTVINLLDWEFPTSPLSISAGWMDGAGTTTENGVTLSDNFDVAFYVKGDIKPATLFSTELVMDYEELTINNAGVAINGGATDDHLVGQGGNSFAGGAGDDLFVMSYGVFDSTAITASTISDFEAGSDVLGLIDLEVNKYDFAYAIDQELVGDTLNISLNGTALASLAGLDALLGLGDFLILNPNNGGITAETLIGSEENDELTGDATANVAFGLGGEDTMFGAAGGDKLYGDAGLDQIWGGTGYDRLHGGAANDALWGEAGEDALFGGLGKDRLEGGIGADVLDGGAGIDVAVYKSSSEGVVVNLETGIGTGGEAEGDTLADIERVRGSDFDDNITGTDDNNVLRGHIGDDVLKGLAGDDVLRGGLGGDTLRGGAGDDTANYASSTEGVKVNLRLATADGGHATGDTLIQIERLVGSDHNDRLIGDANQNRLVGHAGDDTLNGRAGDDILKGGAGDDRMTGGLGADTFCFGRAAFGQDVITDWTDGVDLLDFSDTGFVIDDFVLVQNKDDALLVLGADQANRLTLLDTDISEITALDFV